MIVADTNLAAYLLLAGPRTPAARHVLLLDPDWAAPPLWRSEFRSVLVQHLRQGLITADHGRRIWGQAAALLSRHEREPDPGRVLSLAVDRGLSAYDAEFVAVAEALGCPVVTDDRRLLAACPDLAASIDAFAESAGAPGAGSGQE